MDRYSLYFKIMPQQKQSLGESPAKDFFRVTKFVSLPLPSLGILFAFLSVCVSPFVGCLLVCVLISLVLLIVFVSLFMCSSFSLFSVSQILLLYFLTIADNSDQVE